jgi:hypothetical protein
MQQKSAAKNSRQWAQSHGPCFLHQRSRHLSLGGLLTISTLGSAMTPLIHGTSSGMGPGQISSLTAHGQILRGACRMISGYFVWPKWGSASENRTCDPTMRELPESR